MTVAFSPEVDAGQVEAPGHLEDREYPFPVQLEIGADLWEVAIAEEHIGPAWPVGSP
jgi:hypothetical protein